MDLGKKYMAEKKQQQNKELDEATLEQIVQELTDRRNKILQDMEDIGKKDDHEKDGMTAAFPDYGDKPDENAQEITDYSTNLATEKILEKTLRDIDATLDSIKKGTYGICKYCGEPIAKKRLIARPVASACVACKTKLQNS